MYRRQKKLFTGYIAIFLCCFFLFVFVSVITLYDRVFSYDTTVAHPTIAELAAKLYNEQFPDKKLTDEEINWIKQGTIDEDNPTRWLNHFYDPVYNHGIWFGKQQLSAKEWYNNPSAQKNFSLGDYTWGRALAELKDGNEKEAFKGLGHLIHLLSDMTVPAHTRNDIHVVGDSYEQFLKYNWRLVNGKLENSFQSVSDLDKLFDDLSKLSNRGFYSDDTINNKKYILPNLNSEILLDDYFFAKNGDCNYKLVHRKVSLVTEKIIYELNDEVLSDYSFCLLPRAISYSAGVIKLFFDEIEKGVKYDVPKTKISFLGKTNELLGFAINKAGELWDKLKGKDETLVMAELPPTLSPIAPEAVSPPLDMAEVKASSPFPVSDLKKNAEAQAQTLPSTEIVVAPEPELIIIFEDKKEDKKTETEKSLQTALPVTSTAPIVYYTYSYGSGGGGGGGGGGLHSSSNSNNDQSSSSNDQTDSSNQTATSTPETTTTTPEIILPKVSVNTATTPINIATTTISGTKNEATANIILNVTSTVSYPSSTAWQADLYLPDGENIIEVYGENSTGQHSVTSTITIIVDTTAPDVPSINVVQSEFATPTLYVSWQSLDSGTGVDNFDVEYSNSAVEWTRIFTNTTGTDYAMEAERLKTYQFRARAYDKIGNISEWSNGQQIIPDWPKSVVINEVAWMGTGPSATQRSDEWLELYNNTGADINLTGWKIFTGSTPLNFTNLVNPIISANGYLLLERTDDNAVYDIPADIIFTGDIPNSCSGLTLADASGNTIDQIGCSGANWYAGNTSDYRTMERLSPTTPGGLATNWQASDSVVPKGRPYGGSVIYGSPKLPNTGYWLLKGSLASYYSNLISNNILTLTKAHSPYFLDYQTIIPTGLTVKVEPGAVLVGYDRSSFFDVSGELQFNGTAEEPIIITSALDNNYFHRPDFSTLSSGQPAGGDWGRIEIKQGGKFSASQARFLYGGSRFYKSSGWVYGQYMAQAIRNLGGEIDLNNAEFRNFYLETRENEKTYNALVWSESSAVGTATTTVQNSLFSGGYIAVKNNQSSVSSTIIGSTFENFSNPTGPIVSQYNFPAFSNNIFISNSSDMMDLGGWTLNTDATLNPGVNYLFNSITVPAGLTLTISPGVNLMMKSGDIQVNGSLKALGAVEAPININPLAGWQWGILLFSNSDSVLQNVNFSGGNVSSLRPVTSRGVITVENSNLLAENIDIIDSDRPESMIYFNNSTVDIKNSSLVWTAPWHLGSWLTRGITLNGGVLNLDNASFNQMDYGIYIISGQIGEMENMDADNFQNISISNQWPLAF